MMRNNANLLLLLLLCLDHHPSQPLVASAAAATADPSTTDSRSSETTPSNNAAASATASASSSRRQLEHLPLLSRSHLTKILNTALEDEVTLRHLPQRTSQHDETTIHNDKARRLQGLPSQELEFMKEDDGDGGVWDSLVAHGWEWSRRHLSGHRRHDSGRQIPNNRGSGSGRNLRSDQDFTRSKPEEPSSASASSPASALASASVKNNSPFIICSEDPTQSGYQRRLAIATSLSNIPMEQIQTVYNTEEESCFIVPSTVDAMELYQSRLMVSAEFDLSEPTTTTTDSPSKVSFTPLLDILKLPSGTAMNILSNNDWAPPPINSVSDLYSLKRNMTNEFSYDNSTLEVDVDITRWRRSFMVDLLPGSVVLGASGDAGGTGGTGSDGIENLANEIVDYVKDMAQVPPPPPPPSGDENEASSSSSSSYLRSNSIIMDHGASSTTTRIATEALISTREAFSLTATTNPNNNNDDDETGTQHHMFHNKHSIWSTALSQGFEAPHGCQVMLDTLEVRTTHQDDNTANSNTDNIQTETDSSIPATFELILHPPSQYISKPATVESSAWNVHCAISLLMGLSVHPLVQSVEVGLEVELATMSVDSESMESVMSNDGGGGLMQDSTVNDEFEDEIEDDEAEPDLTSHNWNKKEGITNPQWITQSGKLNQRPFFDMGLDGSGQVVAVADGGLDQDNCYFRDSRSNNANAIYGKDGWNMNRRKIVHYDDTFGDRTERTNGHGTYVSSIVSGKRSINGKDEQAGHADGTAPGSKLAFFDMENGYFGISDPGVDRLFSSLYNPTSNSNKGGARVINGSWGRSYNGRYTNFCRQYDAALRNDYPDLLFVVSAGNTGRSGKSSIQDPGDCKNPLAVGSTLSYGTDIRSNELGIDYLADYSSRGPSMDGRMKPDICAPGHFVLAARANPDVVGECDGLREPNVKMNVPGGDGVKYTTGTSMAAPVLAGSAAILRQYFEEGYCNSNNQKCCGYQGCGTTNMNPSGSLLKAILMNGAQPLRGGVQKVPSGEILKDEQLRPYDSNQGMGRVNLLNSVPLRGKNNFQMMAVNDKFIVNGETDVYNFFINKPSGGCDRALSVTLAWYDAPATIGCTSCLVNDLDLSVKFATGTKYPNGRTSKDSKNTVERVQTATAHGEAVRILVDAKNFATFDQKYSLVVTGCFSDNAPNTQQNSANASNAQRSPTKRPTKRPTKQPTKRPTTPVTAYTATIAKTNNCPNRLFKLALNTANDGQQLTWNLIANTSSGGVERIMSGPPSNSGYANNQQYLLSTCLPPSKRYRFQVRNKSGGNIRGGYKLSYGGNVIFNSAWSSSGNLGRVSTFRFKTQDTGRYQQLGSNTFKTHVQLIEETEISSEMGLADVGGISSSHDSGSLLSEDSNDSMEHILVAVDADNYEAVGRGMLDDDENEDEEPEVEETFSIDANDEEDGEELVGDVVEHVPPSTEEYDEIDNGEGGGGKLLGDGEYSEEDGSRESDGVGDEDGIEVEGGLLEHTPESEYGGEVNDGESLDEYDSEEEDSTDYHSIDYDEDGDNEDYDEDWESV